MRLVLRPGKGVRAQSAPPQTAKMPKDRQGMCVENRLPLLSAKRRIFSKKFRKMPKKHLQRRETCAIIILGCERLGRNVTSVLRKPRYALMREVALRQ